MEDQPSSVILIFREREKRWRDEHPINIAAAVMTNSKFHHVEIAIGDESGNRGEMRNVVRIFNDAVGVELCQRTGRSPMFQYLQIGCSQRAERKMLAFARGQVGKPFSMWAMVRSIIWPRQTTGDNYFCAELVASILQVGGLMSSDSNPGAATPKSLYQMYVGQAATTGNPYTMRSLTQRAHKDNTEAVVSIRPFGFLHQHQDVGAALPPIVNKRNQGQYQSVSTVPQTKTAYVSCAEQKIRTAVRGIDLSAIHVRKK